MASEAGDPRPARRRVARVGKPDARRCAQCGEIKQLRNFPYVYAEDEPPGVCRRCLWMAKAAAGGQGRAAPTLVAALPAAAAVAVEPAPESPEPEPIPEPAPPPAPKVDRWPALLRACGAPSDDLAQLIARQGGVCGCCGRPFDTQGPRIHRDRDQPEQTSFCAILCHRCLSALGLLGNDVRLVARALDYLQSVTAGAPVTTAGEPVAERAPWRVLTPGMVRAAPLPWQQQARARIAAWRASRRT